LKRPSRPPGVRGPQLGNRWCKRFRNGTVYWTEPVTLPTKSVGTHVQIATTNKSRLTDILKCFRMGAGGAGTTSNANEHECQTPVMLPFVCFVLTKYQSHVASDSFHN
jgi:hypothetical protein